MKKILLIALVPLIFACGGTTNEDGNKEGPKIGFGHDEASFEHPDGLYSIWVEDRTFETAGYTTFHWKIKNKVGYCENKRMSIAADCDKNTIVNWLRAQMEEHEMDCSKIPFISEDMGIDCTEFE